MPEQKKRIWHQGFIEMQTVPAYGLALERHLAAVRGPDTEVVVHGLRPGTYTPYWSPAEIARHAAAGGVNELAKFPGVPHELALEPGPYTALGLDGIEGFIAPVGSGHGGVLTAGGPFVGGGARQGCAGDDPSARCLPAAPCPGYRHGGWVGPSANSATIAPRALTSAARPLDSSG